MLTPRVPSLTCDVVAPAFRDLVASIPAFSASEEPSQARNFDWALHPGGSTIITGVQTAMSITEDHLRASYEIYMNYGNSSSATIISVMNRLRNFGEGRDNVVACAFGPGICLEMMILRRRRNPENGHLTNGHLAADESAQTNGFAGDHNQVEAQDLNGTDGIPMEDVD